MSRDGVVVMIWECVRKRIEVRGAGERWVLGSLVLDEFGEIGRG